MFIFDKKPSKITSEQKRNSSNSFKNNFSSHNTCKTLPLQVQRRINPATEFKQRTMPLQRPEDVHREAAKGVQGAGQPLPYFDRVQQAFGHHDISHIKAYMGTEAKAASRHIGAQAYATGNKIAFAESNPSLHMVAHEATHIMQQQAGVRLKDGISQVNDRYEQQADKVANFVKQGRSAESTLAFSHAQASIQNNEVNPATHFVQRGFASVQKKVIRYNDKNPNSFYSTAAFTYAEALDTAVQTAYAAILDAPYLGRLSNLDGYTEYWVKILNQISGGNHSLRSSIPRTFGYVIESIVSKVLLPRAPDSYTVLLQVPRGGTRPDVILQKDNEDVAWYDFTADKSEGHITHKANGWERIPNTFEITYPSVNPSTLDSMNEDKNKALNFKGHDIQALNNEIVAAQNAYLKEKETWRKIGEKNLQPILDKIPVRGDTEQLIGFSKRLKAAKTELGKMFSSTLDDRTAALMIKGMGLEPNNFGFYLGGLSEAEAFSTLKDMEEKFLPSG
jgi:Domain of unknown function (DUF4157)